MTPLLHDTIPIWVGRTLIALTALWLLKVALTVLWLACRDTLTFILNALDAFGFKPRWLVFTPIIVLSSVWEQTKAALFGYNVEIIRIRKG